MMPTTEAGVLVAGLMTMALVSCGGSKNLPPPAVTQETSQAEITRISTTWTSTEVDKAILSPPSPISVRAETRTSRLVLSESEATEILIIDEQFDLRAGGKIRCQTTFEQTVSLRFGRKSGEAALEITRPPLSAPRSCDAAPPEATLSEPERRALFVLGSDQLKAVEPPLDERIYRPLSE